MHREREVHIIEFSGFSILRLLGHEVDERYREVYPMVLLIQVIIQIGSRLESRDVVYGQMQNAGRGGAQVAKLPFLALQYQLCWGSQGQKNPRATDDSAGLEGGLQPC